uniref:Uncharacterized protein n=1 Tax=Tanacetum cinerariifolium TaxID=118510 RepID=A0A6L2LNI4_TANCI|nr:hypothetical protein [Tanacetum cinerariifolium]
MSWKVGKGWMAGVTGRGEVGKGGLVCQFPDLVVMAKVGASDVSSRQAYLLGWIVLLTFISLMGSSAVALLLRWKRRSWRVMVHPKDRLGTGRILLFYSILLLQSISAIWLEKMVTPLIDPAIKGFAAAPAVLKPERLKVDKARFKYFGRLCHSEIYRLISLALDSISALLLFGDRRLERTATFSISTISD